MRERLRVAYVTAALGGAAAGAHDEDLPLAVAALDRAGADVTVVGWRQPSAVAAATAADVAVLRSVWDYYPHDRAALVAFATAVPGLRNPARTVAWNTDKSYLATLAAAGVPVVPTLLDPDGPSQTWAAAFPAGWAGTGRLVVKPAISAGATDTGSGDPGWAGAAVQRLRDAGRSALVQPYAEAVDVAGETSVIFFGGVFSHAWRKPALLTADAPAGPAVRAALVATTPRPDQRAVAGQVLAAAAALGHPDLLYARVDLVDGPDGQPWLLEVELTEPFLGLHLAGAADRFAAAVVDAAAGRR